ncbi:glycosyltransferase family 4 protein [Microlunatus flavus]|uniref:Glycosyltransferase involved in cell wall bisynthesis n=1 Tax=Microlunatus flavus TaxID=1036181 RepID=A0A1H8ZFD9_9ACTN|nr:glycosyltransferase family 4 protein [Microlunatus flavus]SEP62438.1 Glycosyltransferase involved in cell wall bisynthesis [Microlunatus flavus]
MRILHVSDVYLPRLGGMELHVSDLARRQALAGEDVTVATATAGPTEEGVVRLDRPGRRQADLERLVARLDVDVVHAHSSLVSPLAWAGTRAAAAAGVPAVVTLHSLWPQGAPGRALGALLRDVPEGTAWTAVSTVAARVLAPALPGRTVGVLPNAVDPAAWAPRTPLTPGPAPVLVSVMRFAPRKRPLALLRVLEEVRRRVGEELPLRALLVGEGPLDAAVRRRIARPALSGWVTATGRLDRPEIQRLLERADLYLAPSRQESFGIAALEARCAGLPVVGMAGTGLADFVTDGVDGHLVGSDEELADRLVDLVREPGALEALRRTARRPVEGLDWATVLDRHRALYGSLLPAGAAAAVSTGAAARR